MKVLVVGVNYAPEITGIAPYTTAMANGLVQAGHDVRVITGVPHYPQWKNFTNFRGMRRKEVSQGVPITRVRHFIGSGGMGLGRIHQELSFGIQAVLQHWGDADVVVTVSPALLSSALVVAKARLTGRAVGVWVQDLYSNGAKEIGDNGIASRALAFVEGAVMRAATGVLVIHERFRRHLVEDLAVPEERVAVSRNWSHLSATATSDPTAIRQRYFGDAEAVALHTGNMGAKQALENVVDAARLADEHHSPVVFGLVGDGSQRESLEAAGEGVDHLVFVPSLEDSDYAAILQCADVLIVNEKQGLRESAVPSKLTSYFVQGKPVVAATEADSATADEVRAAGAGPVVLPGEPAALLSKVEELAASPGTSAELGHSARRFAEENFTADSAVARVSQWLTTLTTNSAIAGRTRLAQSSHR